MHQRIKISILLSGIKFRKQATMLLVTCLSLNFPVLAQDGEALFKKTCTACHTIGGGRIVGPDLKGVTGKRPEEWLILWIKSSQTLIKSGDADAVAIYNEFNQVMMPDNNLADAEIKSIIGYMRSAGGGEATAQTTPAADTVPPVATVSSDQATAEEILLGQNLFDGTVRLQNGGASCISCHNVASSRLILGGGLAKDLTNAHSRLGGDAGIKGMLNAPPFPAMAETYRNKQINEQEITAITAFLNKVDKESQVTPVELSQINPLMQYGFAGFAVWIVIVILIWRSRKKNTVKLNIFNRQLKSH